MKRYAVFVPSRVMIDQSNPLQVTSSHDGLHQSMEDHRGNEERLQRQLLETRERYQKSCDEIQELRGQLSSTATSLEEQYQLLSNQV